MGIVDIGGGLMDFDSGRKLPFRSGLGSLPGPAVTISRRNGNSFAQECTVDTIEMHGKCSPLQQSPACTLDYASEGSELSVSEVSDVVQEVSIRKPPNIWTGTCIYPIAVWSCMSQPTVRTVDAAIEARAI